jgi:hypothetical protein
MDLNAPTFSNTAEIKAEVKRIPKIGLMACENDKIYTHSLLLLGLLNRTYELTESVIWAMDNDRPLTTANMLRALYETLGFTYYIKEQIDSSSSHEEIIEKISSLLMGSRNGEHGFKSVNILTCIDKAVKTFPELRKNYDELSEMVHPNSSSHFYSGKATGKDNADRMHVKIGIPFYEFKNEDKKNMTNQVGKCCHHICSLCETIIIFFKKYT